MKMTTVKWILVALTFGAALYAFVFFYGSHSESFRFVETAMRNSRVIQDRVGNVQKVSLDPSGEYLEKFFNMKKFAEMTVDIRGSRGEITANVSASKIDGSWRLNKIIIHGKSVYNNEAGDYE